MTVVRLECPQKFHICHCYFKIILPLNVLWIQQCNLRWCGNFLLAFSCQFPKSRPSWLRTVQNGNFRGIGLNIRYISIFRDWLLQHISIPLSDVICLPSRLNYWMPRMIREKDYWRVYWRFRSTFVVTKPAVTTLSLNEEQLPCNHVMHIFWGLIF